MNMPYKPYVLLLFLSSTFALNACHRSDGNDDLRHYLTELKLTQKVKGKQSPKINFVWPKTITYKAAKLRSPFVDTSQVTPVIKVGINQNPLQAYPLTMLKFVGTVESQEQTTAYIMTPDTMIYPVTIGNKIADHDGVVTSISDDSVTVQEAGLTVTLKLKDGAL
jgi:Tfp pilus assembly protein PilP